MARPHAAALAEDAWHRQLERGLRRRGWNNRIIGHVGYGTSSPATPARPDGSSYVDVGDPPDATAASNVVRVFGRVVLSRDRQSDDDEPDRSYGGMRSLHARDRGWRAFVAAPAMDVPVSVTVGDRTFHTRADRSGHIDGSFRGHDLGPGWHHVTLTAQGAEPAEAEVFVVGPDVTHGLVSDIDDTVISTSLPRVMIAAWNTFVRHEAARRVVPGMAPMYRDLLAGHPGAPIVYVSTGAWNTAPTLTRFLRGHGYPMGPLLLTDWGPTNTGWFRSGQEHKRASLDRLARDFPAIKWTLVGDDGQHDPKIYQDFAEARPEVVDAIAIRQLTPAEQVLSHGIPVSNEELSPRNNRAAKDVPVYYAPDGYGLQRILRAAGKMSEPTSS